MDNDSDNPKGFGSTLSGGIQDVSALLPLLGTEQCETHVGSALDKGFLYAAAAPLSIFGSLGIVKVAFSTLAATLVTQHVNGARWLRDAGFGTPGTVSSLVGVEKGSMEYGAEIRFRQLLDSQYIDDPNLISSIEWSGWTADDSGSTQEFAGHVPWNIGLILASVLGSVLAISPYLYLIQDNWDDPLSWIFPVFRTFGSCVCVVCIQLALQLRILRIVRSRLFVMKLHKQNPGCQAGPSEVLEKELRTWFSLLPVSESKGKVNIDDSQRKEAAALLEPDRTLLLYQASIVLGMGMIVSGYVGCFSLVGESGVRGGPYVWVGLEAFLSSVRMYIWGSDPLWDEGTGLKLMFRLRASDQVNPEFPPITTPCSIDQGTGFVAHPEDEFLRSVESHTGPLHRFKNVSIRTIFYAVVPGSRGKLLCAIVTFPHSQNCLSLIFNDEDSTKTILSVWKMLPESASVFVQLGEEIDPDIARLTRDVYEGVRKHSRGVARQLFGPPTTSSRVKWTLLPDSRTQMFQETPSAVTGSLTECDQSYIEVKRGWDQKSTFLANRITSVHDDAKQRRLLAFESMILELRSCLQEGLLLKRWGTASLSRSLLLECTNAMRSRIDNEMETIEPFIPREEISSFRLQWEQVRIFLQSLREHSTARVDQVQTLVDLFTDLHSVTEHDAIQLFKAAVGQDKKLFDFLPHPYSNMFSRYLRPISDGSGSTAGSLPSLDIPESPPPPFTLDNELELTILRLKRLLTHGFIEPLHPYCLSSTSSTPYTLVDGETDFHMRREQSRGVSPRVLQVYRTTSEQTDHFLRHLRYRDAIDNLTTLDLSTVTQPFSLATLFNFLSYYENIIAIALPAFINSDEPYEQIRRNRARWVERASTRSFQYLAGFEPAEWLDDLRTAWNADARGEVLVLRGNHVESIVLLTVPRPGRVRVTFNASFKATQDNDETSVAFTIEARYNNCFIEASKRSPNRRSITNRPQRPGDIVPLEVELELETGNYEVWCQLYDRLYVRRFIELHGLPDVVYTEA